MTTVPRDHASDGLRLAPLSGADVALGAAAGDLPLRGMGDCLAVGSVAALHLLSDPFELLVECEERSVVDQRGR